MQNGSITQKQNITQRFSAYQLQTLAFLQLSTQDFIKTIKDEYDRNPLLEFPNEYEYASRGVKSDFEDVLGSGGADEYDIQGYLLMQLDNMKLSVKERSVSKYLVQCMDRNGYLHPDIEEIRDNFKVSRHFTLRVLRIMRNLDPSGICARNLSESLMIQLIHRGERRLALYRLIKFHLLDLASNRTHSIAESLGISAEQVAEFVSIIKSLNPRPGADTKVKTNPEYIIPELIINYEKGELDVQANRDLYTPPSISTWYIKNIDPSQKEAYEFIKENLKRAKSLIRAISQRQQTIQKVAKFICIVQQEYLKNASNPLQPLNMMQVADSLNFNVSTISRAIHGKYIQTPRGTIALKLLLSNHAAGSDKVSVQYVHQRLKQIINNEDKKAPYSDGELQKILKRDNINLNKRTITNYRNKLSIPAASIRKNLL